MDGSTDRPNDGWMDGFGCLDGLDGSHEFDRIDCTDWINSTHFFIDRMGSIVRFLSIERIWFIGRV